MQYSTLKNWASITSVFLWYCEIFKNTYFAEHLRMTALQDQSFLQKLQKLIRVTLILEPLSDELADLKPANFINKETKHRRFPVFYQASFLRTPSKNLPYWKRLNPGKNCHSKSLISVLLAKKQSPRGVL